MVKVRIKRASNWLYSICLAHVQVLYVKVSHTGTRDPINQNFGPLLNCGYYELYPVHTIRLLCSAVTFHCIALHLTLIFSHRCFILSVIHCTHLGGLKHVCRNRNSVTWKRVEQNDNLNLNLIFTFCVTTKFL